MSNIDGLIKELCPNGVEYKKLSEIGYTFTGLSNKSKDDFANGNCRYITYTNIYNNPAVKLDLTDMVLIKENEKQNSLKYGDILVAGSSESIEDSGMIAVVCEKPTENIYLNSFCFGLRLNDIYNKKIIPGFSKHIFRSANFRNQILSCSFGVTRYNLNKKIFLELTIPIPPLKVQEEIVQILDKFDELEAELETELEAELEVRRNQYEFWREKLLSSSEKTYKLKDICDISAGGTPSKSKSEYWENGTIKWLGSSVCENKKTVREVTSYITELGLSKSSAKLLKPGSTLIAMVGATIGKVAYLDFEACTNQNVACLYPKDATVISNDYLYYLCTTLYKKFTDLANGSFTIASLGFIKELEVKIPDLNRQKEIVAILDKFDRLVDDISVEIPAEIELRRQQYEYYRNKLLSFKEVDT